MKGKLKRVLMVIPLFLVLAAGAYGIIRWTTPALVDRPIRYYQQHRETLQQIARLAEAGEMAGHVSPAMEQALSGPEFSKIVWTNQGVNVYFVYSNHLAEGVLILTWLPQDRSCDLMGREIDLSSLHPGESRRVTEQDGPYELGMGDRGYMDFYKIEDHWYRLNAYYPT